MYTQMLPSTMLQAVETGVAVEGQRLALPGVNPQRGDFEFLDRVGSDTWGTIVSPELSITGHHS